MRVFHAEKKRIPKTEDSLAERGELELPVPICEHSDDSIRLRFATSRRTAKRYRPAAHFYCALGSLGATEAKWPALLLDAAATSVAMSFIAHEGKVSECRRP